MPWVKKNLFILIAGVVSLAVLGYAIFFVKGKMEADEIATASLDEAAQKFKDLVSRKYHPGTEKVNNIQIAKDELVKMQSFMEEMREYLKGPVIATNLNNRDFRALLDNSITDLLNQSEEAGVVLPSTNYWFTYSSFKTTVDFKGDAIGLAAQLEDIKSIMNVLCAARVHTLVGLRRVAVSDNEGFSGEIIAGRQPKTNDWAVSTGYEVTFQGFSSELARVMEGIANAKQCFVVKSIGVAKAPEERKAAATPMYMPPPQPMYNNYSDRGRYSQRPMMPMMPMMPAAPAARAGQPGVPKTILDENKLRFTLQVDSIRLKPKGT